MALTEKQRVKFVFEPAHDGLATEIPTVFDIVMKTDSVVKDAAGRRRWGAGTYIPNQTVLSGLTRAQVAALLASGADWLAYSGEE